MPSWPRTEEMCSTRPPFPPSIIARTAAWVGSSAERRLRSSIRSHSASGYSSAGYSAPPAPPPTALMITSTRPNA